MRSTLVSTQLTVVSIGWMGVCLSFMPVNWNGRDAIRDLSLRSRGDFQLHELLDLIPLLLVRRRGIFVVGDTLATLSWLYPIRRPRLWQTLVGAILRPYGAGTPKSEHLHVLKSVGASELTAHNCREYNNLVAAAGTNCLVGVLAPSELERDFASARLESSRNSLISDS